MSDEPNDHVDGVLARRRDPSALHLQGKPSATARLEPCASVDSEP